MPDRIAIETLRGEIRAGELLETIDRPDGTRLLRVRIDDTTYRVRPEAAT